MSQIGRRIRIFATVVLVTGGAGIVAVNCGSNDDSGAGPAMDAGGMDATTDSASDGGYQADALHDGAAPDATLTSDAADADAGATTDTATGSDAGADGDAAVVESGAELDADAAIDAPAYDGTAASFPGQLAATLCQRVAACCGTSANAPTFNNASCIAEILPGGFNGSGTGTNLLDGGHVAFNAVAAQGCLDNLNQIDCDTNQIPGAVERGAFLSCYGAFAGTLPLGSPCAGTIECDPGSFCLPVDGGVGDAGAIGICQPLVGDGGACGNLLGSASASQSACSYRGSGNTGLQCKTFDPSAPTQSVDAAAWVCAPQDPNGIGCARAVSCSSFECPTSTLQCAASIVAVTSSTCASLIVDAGTDQ
jgi:hypothetical protein